jgi:hypothetical protein
MKVRLGCVSASGVIAGLLALVVVVGVSLLWGGVLFSPGPLNAQAGGSTLGNVSSHAELGRRCSECHAAPWSRETMSDRCLACHTEIARQLQEPSSLHSVLGVGGPGLACYDCHPEHRGTDAPLTQVDVDAFPHEATGYALQGHRQTAAGGEFACADCHGQSLTHFDVAACADCHRGLDDAYTQTHIETFGADCLACHDGIDTYGRLFDHDGLAFPLQGRHASTGCAGCHEGARSVADLQSAPQDCFSCHAEDDAHDGQFGQDCAACHTPEGWEAATFDHAQTAFALLGKHVAVDCGDCHVDGVYQGTPQDCVSCHLEDDAHEGQFGQDCAECHTPEDWKEATFDHAQTAFPLLGEHVTVECGDCHLEGVYRGTPLDCFSCHADDDAHEGQFGQDCAGCHTPEDWKAATFDHTQTAFPLTGAHIGTDCLNCHVGGVFSGTSQVCSACHDDPVFHLGLLGSDCAACHTTEAWSPARYDRQHTFPFSHGERGPSPCLTCHPDTLSAYTCYDCHDHDPAEIEEEHRKEGIADFQDCVRCHPTGLKEEGEGEDD